MPSFTAPAATSGQHRRSRHLLLFLAGLIAVSSLPVSTVAAVAGVTRQAGANRFATAAAISAANFSPGVNIVYVANGLGFADALAAGPAAADNGGPVLLVNQNNIPAETAAELDRLNPDAIVVAGGTGVVSPAVETQLETYSSNVSRQAGANRFATAAAISAANFSPGVNIVYVANGLGFPDALAAGPAAADNGGPVLLVTQNTIPTETAAELDRLNPDAIVIAGGTGVVAATMEAALDPYTTGSVTRQAGANRFATAAAISAANFSPGVSLVYVANGLGFPDALAAGPAAADNGGPVLLVQQNSIPAETAAELDRLDPDAIVVAGGTGVVSTGVENALGAYVGSGNQLPNAVNDNLGNVRAGCSWQYRVLNNDTDPEGGLLSIASVSNPPHGTATILTHKINGVDVPRLVRYVPDGGYTGADSFTYTVSDPLGGQDIGTVSLTVVASASDTDGDTIPDECDAFATDSSNASGLTIPFALSFDGGAGGIEDAGFTGLMTNSVTPSLTQFDGATVGPSGGRFNVPGVTEGDAFNGDNTQRNGFQVNVTTPVSDFTVHGRVCGPYPMSDFASVGIFLGAGDQDDYVKATVKGSANGAVHDAREVNGDGVGIATKTDTEILAAACVDLYLFVETDADTYLPYYSLDGGATKRGFTAGLGGRTVPDAWTSGAQPLAVGIIATSQGPSPEFAAQWDFLEVVAGQL